MKLRSLLLFILMMPAIAYCQTIVTPAVAYAEDYTTTITKIDNTGSNTVITFKHTIANKNGWMELNKSIYLQDANGEARYNYIKSEGIPLRPEKLTADRDNQEVTFTIYFEKVQPDTKAINIIERARSPIEQASSNKYFNFFNVSLERSAHANGEHIKTTDVVLMAPDPIADTAFSVNTTNPFNSITQNMGPMMAQMYTGMLDAQLKTFSDPAIITKLAQITKNYFNALVKAGFTQDMALKIITSKQLISMDGK